MTTLRCFLFFLVSSWVCQAFGTTRMIIIRHGELTPPDMKAGKPVKDPFLTNIGVMRSWALVPFLADFAPKIDAVYALNRSAKIIPGSFRPMETCKPLADSRHLEINASFKGQRISSMQDKLFATHLRANMQDGETAIICMDHERIQAIATALGVKNAPKWKGDDFESVWEIQIDNQHAKMRQHKEKLPETFLIPTGQFAVAPISDLEKKFPLQYAQLIKSCPIDTANSNLHTCNVSWKEQIFCCGQLLYSKRKTASSAFKKAGCQVTREQCEINYGLVSAAPSVSK